MTLPKVVSDTRDTKGVVRRVLPVCDCFVNRSRNTDHCTTSVGQPMDVPFDTLSGGGNGNKTSLRTDFKVKTQE